MKKIITALSLLCFLFIKPAIASHIAGGDLSYVCLGGNQYRINLNLFADCFGVDPGTTHTINFSGPCGTVNSITVNLINTGGTEISQLCASQINNSTCHNGSLPGMRVFHYTGTVTLPPCDSWTMSWNICCRNAAVLNITNPDLFGSYIEAKLNSVASSCNNSPSFNAQPIPYVCLGQQVNYSYGVVETDGDSLYYSLIGARDAGPTALTYSPGYSASSPIPGITINSGTGMITFTPSQNGNFVVVVLVKEYDSNGVLIGTVMRDIQFIVQTCSNSVPDPSSGVITGMTGTAVQSGPFSIEMCEQANFTFNASFSDPDLSNNLTLTSTIASVLPGAVITTSGTNPLVATVSWMAPSGTANTNTTFSITVNDGACPVPGQQTYVYDIEVQPRTTAGPDRIICGSQAAALSAVGGTSFTWSMISGRPIVVGTNFSCTSCPNPLANPDSTTTYEVTSDLSGCVNKDTVTVIVVPDFSFVTTESTATLCLQQTVQLNITGSPAGTYLYSWSPSADLNNTTIANPLATLNTAGTYPFYVNITSPFGCLKKDTITAVVQPYLRTTAGGDTILCGPQSASLSANGGSTFTWSVISGPPLVVGTNISCNPCQNPVVTPTDTTVYVVTSDLTGTCINRDTVTVIVVPDYSVNITQDHTITCLATPVQLNATITPAGTYSYSWSPSAFLNNDSIPNPIATITSPGAHSYTLTTVNNQGCVKQNTVTVTTTQTFAPDLSLSVISSPACIGDTVQLHADAGFPIPTSCAVGPVVCTSSRTGTVGAGNSSNTTTSYPAPYGNFYTTVRQQFLYTAAELNAAGVIGGKINQLDFNVLSINGIDTYHSYSISMKCTNLTTFSATATTFQSGLLNVFPATTYTISTGWNPHVFSSAFDWDGVSNIIVQVCFSELNPGSNFTDNSITASDATTNISTLYSLSDGTNQCSAGSPFVQRATEHPQIRFHYCPGAPPAANLAYAWTPATAVVSPASATTNAYVSGSNQQYTVVVTDNLSGCKDTSSINVIGIPHTTITVNAGNDITICPGLTASLNATGAAQYTWSPAATLSSATVSNPVASPVVSTTYTVVGTTQCAPSSTDSVRVIIRPSTGALVANAGSDQTVCSGEEVDLSGSTSGGYGANSYYWSVVPSGTISNPASLSTSVTAGSPGITLYELAVTDQCGNSANDTIMIEVAPDCQVIVPNVFTPNSDGKNDEFKVTGNGVKSYSITIYNRWGEKVYESNDIESSWTGQGAHDGTYYFIMKAETTNGKAFDKQGYIQLLRD